MKSDTELTAFGKTKTLKEWATEYGMEVRSLRGRLERRAKGGTLTTEIVEGALQAPVEDKSVGARTRNIQRLMLAVEENVSQEQLNKEVRDYVAAKGALSFYKEFQFLWPKGTSVALDGGNAGETKPARITIFNASLPDASGMTIDVD